MQGLKANNRFFGIRIKIIVCDFPSYGKNAEVVLKFTMNAFNSDAKAFPFIMFWKFKRVGIEVDLNFHYIV